MSVSESLLQPSPALLRFFLAVDVGLLFDTFVEIGDIEGDDVLLDAAGE